VKPAPRRGAKPPPRGVKPPARTKRRRLGTVLFLIGLLAVLGGTFAAGALAGRLSFRPSASLNATKTAARIDKPAPTPQPELSFYRELTAPLHPTAPPPKPAVKAAPKPTPTESPRPAEAATAASTPAAEAPQRSELENAQAATAGVAVASRADGKRYTIQVAAYNVRGQADELRARLASNGLEAYVVEGESGGVTRYRVRIGTYDTADEAKQAAAKIASQAHVATYVTTR
jgi:cell division protein FtsN